MKHFMDEEFLLSNDTASRLYHAVAERQPIYDFHCHLSPSEIAENKRFSTITEMWLGGDHYKWRAMRANGIDEKYITGSAEPYDKFLAWARTLPCLLGNPLYHWAHLELKRYFGIDEVLSEKTAPAIWKEANEKLAGRELEIGSIFDRFKVYAVGTTDDPADSLEWHAAIAKAGRFATKVIPSFRPDKALNIGQAGFPVYIGRLGKSAGIAIRNLSDLKQALASRLDFFVASGCRASDHALEYVPFIVAPEDKVEAILRRGLAGEAPSADEVDAYKTALLRFLGAEYARRGIVMQLHLESTRNINSVEFASLGPDTGNDAVTDHHIAANLGRFLDSLEAAGSLPKTILYSLNPADYYVLGTMMGCFQGTEVPGKMQLGAAWWFCDHRDGMEEQMRLLANVGLLPRFVGMLTDSRSFLSYTRHEYFRRVLCNLLGAWVENGELPDDEELLAGTVANISFRNARSYFG
jgi:glucuronate isomerase